MSPDEKYMLRALELARLGMGKVSPNPLVGCVIVSNNKIIGEGWHQAYGMPHAEAAAISQVEDRAALQGATLYVNLEPCNHQGKTPPCTEAIIDLGIGRVVIATRDTNPLVAGKGLQKLTDHGIETVTGVLEKEGQELNKRFFTSVARKRPYILLKWAQTTDGFIARKDFTSRWISQEPARQRVHQMRSQEDAVLVGTRTASIDNPQLTTRLWQGRNPKRVVIDRQLNLPSTHHLFDGREPTFIYNIVKDAVQPNVTRIRLPAENFLAALLGDLHQRHIQSVIVEGGAATLQAFIDQGLWDEAHVVTSPNTFGDGIKGPALSGLLAETSSVGPDTWQIFIPRQPH